MQDIFLWDHNDDIPMTVILPYPTFIKKNPVIWRTRHRSRYWDVHSDGASWWKQTTYKMCTCNWQLHCGMCLLKSLISGLTRPNLSLLHLSYMRTLLGKMIHWKHVRYNMCEFKLNYRIIEEYFHQISSTYSSHIWCSFLHEIHYMIVQCSFRRIWKSGEIW